MTKAKRPTLAYELVSDMVNKFALTQVEIAEYCGISQPAVYAILNGGGVKPDTLTKLKRLYNREFPAYRARILRAAEALK